MLNTATAKQISEQVTKQHVIHRRRRARSAHFTSAGGNLIFLGSEAEASFVMSDKWITKWLDRAWACEEKRRQQESAPEADRDQQYINDLDRAIANYGRAVAGTVARRRWQWARRHPSSARITAKAVSAMYRRLPVPRATRIGRNSRSHRPVRVAAKKTVAKAAADPDGPSEPPGKRGALQIGGAP